MRKAAIWRWRAQNERDYNWSTKGRSAEAAVYGQALRDEAALARGYCVAATLYDLTKAYESVRLELVWEEGKSSSSFYECSESCWKALRSRATWFSMGPQRSPC